MMLLCCFSFMSVHMAREGCSRHSLVRHCRFKRSMSQLPVRQEQQGTRPHGLQEGSALDIPRLFKNMSPEMVPKMSRKWPPSRPPKCSPISSPKCPPIFLSGFSIRKKIGPLQGAGIQLGKKMIPCRTPPLFKGCSKVLTVKATPKC